MSTNKAEGRHVERRGDPSDPLAKVALGAGLAYLDALRRPQPGLPPGVRGLQRERIQVYEEIVNASSHLLCASIRISGAWAQFWFEVMSGRAFELQRSAGERAPESATGAPARV